MIAGLVAPHSPAYAAGLDQDDEVRQIEDVRVRSADEVSAAIGRKRPGDRLRVAYVDRTGVEKTTTVTLAEDPHVQVILTEAAGTSVTPAQRAFRERWLAGK